MKIDARMLAEWRKRGIIPAGPEPSPKFAGTDATVVVPLPPSVNHLFLNARRSRKTGKPGKGRIRSPHYREWVDVAAPEMRKLAPPQEYPTAVRFAVGGHVNSQRDLDNMLKPLLDLMVSVGVLKEDNVKHVGQVAIRRASNVRFTGVQVRFEKFVPIPEMEDAVHPCG